MAGEFRKLPLKRYQKGEYRKDSQEQKYWKSFQFPTIVKEHSAINHINFSTVAPYDCLVTCSGKLQIFAPYTHEVKRTSNRNKENVYGGRYRADGKLMVAGGESGLVQVLDVNSRSILRNLKGHSKPTRVCSFGKEFTKVFSASDDKTMRCWDLPTEKEALSVKAHKDYIRCGSIHPINTDLFVTGSYDHTVKIWDCRSSSVSIEMNHGAPVEAVLMHRNGTLCLTAGANYIKVWDILCGDKLYYQFSNHQKTITSICFDGDNKRLLSAGLDRQVKVYDVQDFSVVAHLHFPSPILALDVSADSNHLVAGMSDGAISIQNRAMPKDETPVSRKRAFLQPGTYNYRIRNQSSKPDEGDHVVEKLAAAKLSKVDHCLRKFRYHEALDVVLDGDDATIVHVISVLTELSRRDALEIALSDRDENSLTRIIHFLVKNVSNPLYTKTLAPIANLILDTYAHLVGQNKKFDIMLQKLNNRLREDIRTQEEMMKLLGAMEQIFSMITPPPPTDIDLDETSEKSENIQEGQKQSDDIDFVVSSQNENGGIVIN